MQTAAARRKLKNHFAAGFTVGSLFPFFAH